MLRDSLQHHLASCAMWTLLIDITLINESHALFGICHGTETIAVQARHTSSGARK